MKLYLSVELGKKYKNPSQIARVIIESWIKRELCCPNCSHFPLISYSNNYKSADFNCQMCREDFQVKATKKNIGKNLLGAEYKTTLKNIGRINLIIVKYNPNIWIVQDVVLIPKNFFTFECVAPRKILPKTAKRKNWQGCKIVIPETGKIFWVKSGVIQSNRIVYKQWKQKNLLLENRSSESRIWLIDTILYIEKLKRKIFELNDLYKFETEFKRLHQNNNHIKDKLRQQIQILRDRGYLEFLGEGKYRLQ